MIAPVVFLPTALPALLIPLLLSWGIGVPRGKPLQGPYGTMRANQSRPLQTLEQQSTTVARCAKTHSRLACPLVHHDT